MLEFTMLGKFSLLIKLIALNLLMVFNAAQKLNPNEIAPNFTLSTLSGPIIYKGIKSPETNIKAPMIFHTFTSYSGFLEALWQKDTSILDLIDNSPDNTHYIFMNSEVNPHQTALWMKSRFENMLKQYFDIAVSLQKCENKKVDNADRRSFNDNNFSFSKRHRYFPKPHRRIDRRSIEDEFIDDYRSDDLLQTLKHRPKILRNNHATKKWHIQEYLKRNNVDHYHNAHDIFDEHLKNNTSMNKDNVFRDDDQVLKRSLVATMYDNLSADENEAPATSDCNDDALQKRVREIVNGGLSKLKSSWMARLHFVNVSMFEMGNFIPLVLSRWYCSGHGCGYDQVAVESKSGEVHLVSKRIDGRYDWLTSPYSLKSKSPRQQIVAIGDGCNIDAGTKYADKVVLISNDGSCSYFEKLKNAQDADALCAVIYTKSDQTLFDMTCQGKECETEMKIPGTLIPYKEGKQMEQLIDHYKEVYVRFQHTPSWNFFLAIDEQGKLQEVGWLVYPSMIFLSYQAKWLNYMTGLLHNITSLSDANAIPIFSKKIMRGKKGVVVTKTFDLDVKKDLPRYEHVYLDMALGCPGSTDFTCPHWDHTVQLYLNCDDQSSKSRKRSLGPEIGRWITPFRRRIGRWLTDIRPLVPLFSSQKCNFTMKTVPWAMPWKPSLTLRLSNKNSGSIAAPSEVIELFRGGTFDKTYNKDEPRGRRTKTVNIPKDVKKVKLFATITGHGSDNNNCAEFCVTSHHFKINENDNTRIFDNAGTATGCADRVSDGSEPNEHGTWLYGRNGWCDGEKVGPWVEDVTSQVKMGESNDIKYYGHFNNADPEPTRDPGNIIMYSYLVLYRTLE